LDRDIAHPSLEEEKRKHKKKRLVQSPNSYFMDVKCPGCYKITTVFSHAQTVVLCVGCSTVLCQPTGGKARLTEGREAELLSSAVAPASVLEIHFGATFVFKVLSKGGGTLLQNQI
ncbi:40S ribosomal protein S27-like protein, partial [Chelonia mydas]